MDYIRLSNLVFYAHHGFFKEERQLGQRFEMDIEIGCNLKKPAENDNLNSTIDYRKIYTIAKETFENNKFKLLETVAEKIASKVLRIRGVEYVRLKVRKPHVPLKALLDFVEIEITRSVNDK